MSFLPFAVYAFCFVNFRWIIGLPICVIFFNFFQCRYFVKSDLISQPDLKPESDLESESDLKYGLRSNIIIKIEEVGEEDNIAICPHNLEPFY